MIRQLPPSPAASSAKTSNVMRANKAQGTKLELAIRHMLWSRGIRGYRVNWKGAPGRPDICFIKKKLAVFINGCFWHHCPICKLAYPKTNSDFWKKKFELNIARDKAKLDALHLMGWRTLVIWECEIKKDVISQINRIVGLLNQFEV